MIVRETAQKSNLRYQPNGELSQKVTLFRWCVWGEELSEDATVKPFLFGRPRFFHIVGLPGRGADLQREAKDRALETYLSSKGARSSATTTSNQKPTCPLRA